MLENTLMENKENIQLQDIFQLTLSNYLDTNNHPNNNKNPSTMLLINLFRLFRIERNLSNLSSTVSSFHANYF